VALSPTVAGGSREAGPTTALVPHWQPLELPGAANRRPSSLLSSNLANPPSRMGHGIPVRAACKLCPQGSATQDALVPRRRTSPTPPQLAIIPECPSVIPCPLLRAFIPLHCSRSCVIGGERIHPPDHRRSRPSAQALAESPLLLPSETLSPSLAHTLSADSRVARRFLLLGPTNHPNPPSGPTPAAGSLRPGG
jgi:hypothetical protein